MIIEMARIRVLGPAARLGATVRALQDAGVVQPIDGACPPGMSRYADAPDARRRRRHLAHVLGAVEDAIATLAALGIDLVDRGDRGATGIAPAQIARTAVRVRDRVARLAARDRALVDERDALRAYAPLVADLEGIVAGTHRVSVYLLRLHGSAALGELRTALDRAFGGDHVLRTHVLGSGEAVVLLVVPAARADELDRQLAAARVERAVLPGGLGTMPLPAALRGLGARVAELEHELAVVRTEAQDLARSHGDDLTAGRRALHDALAALEAEHHASISPRLFALEGWVPARERDRVVAAVIGAVGPDVTIESIAREDWAGDDVPVVLANPRVFAPFEALTAMLPLPRYGSVDPTPFVAVFFPMLFGVVVGDIGYGLALAAGALAIRLATPRGSRWRDVAKIAAAVSVYAVLFGACYGELFGDLGARWFGLHPLWFDRREALLAFLGLALALGVVHLFLGLVVAAVNRWRRDRRQAIGRGVTAVMLAVTVVALLALGEAVPGVVLMPAVIVLLVLFAALVVVEGATALLELMSIAGHLVSYARVMALGTASVMLAVVANRMHGAFGSAAIGIAFALVFHVVNFAITLMSPTIQVMRLHYVEFFATFFEPGGGMFRPLRHWSPEATAV